METSLTLGTGQVEMKLADRSRGLAVFITFSLLLVGCGVHSSPTIGGGSGTSSSHSSRVPVARRSPASSTSNSEDPIDSTRTSVSTSIPMTSESTTVEVCLVYTPGQTVPSRCGDFGPQGPDYACLAPPAGQPLPLCSGASSTSSTSGKGASG